jgi:hypothetical protein
MLLRNKGGGWKLMGRPLSVKGKMEGKGRKGQSRGKVEGKGRNGQSREKDIWGGVAG